MPLRILLLVSGICLFTLAGCEKSSPGTAGQLSAQAQSGEHVYKLQCAVCHNAHSTAPLHGPGFQGLYKHQELPSGVSLTDEHVKQTIQHGRNMMPPIPIDDDQVADVIAYLKTL